MSKQSIVTRGKGSTFFILSFSIVCVLFSSPREARAELFFYGEYDTGAWPSSVVSGDLDGDGDRDVVAANYDDDTISVFKNDGTGIFGAHVTYPAGDAPDNVIIADFDDDGDLDIATTGRSNSVVSVLKNNGDATFSPRTNYATAWSPFGITGADFDGDDDIDIAVANWNDETFSVFYNDGIGGFSSRTDFTAIGNVWSIIASDFDGNGSADIAVTDSGDTFSVFLNNGSGGFSSGTDYAVPGGQAYGLTVADYDGDDDIDVAVGMRYPDATSVFMNNGSGTFVFNATYAGSPDIQSADINDDGRMDIASTHHLLFNIGGGDFNDETEYNNGRYYHYISVGDFDGNGKDNDFAAVTERYGSLVILIDAPSLQPRYPGISPTPDTTPTFTFTLPSCASGNLQYRIEIDDDPVFGSPTVDYTSGQKDTGNNFFTVGQPEGTGTYAVGSEGQELAYGTYFWRVYSICNSDPSPPDDGDPITIEPAVSTSGVGTTLDINATISLSCDPSVTMNALVGTGTSTIDENNRADCTVITNNSAGYALSWQASTDNLLNAQSDHFAAYSPVASTTPESWDIPDTTSAWGAKLASTSEGYNGGSGGSGYTYPGTGWGSNDSYGSGLWLNVAASEPFQFMQKATETDVDGEVQSLMFAAEIGADKLQPTGTYTTNVTVTAVTLSGGGGGGSGCTVHNAMYGDTVDGTLDAGDCQVDTDGNPSNYYVEKIIFSGTENDQIAISADYPDSTAHIVLTDESGNSIWSGDDLNIPASVFSGQIVLPSTGTYVIWVSTGNEFETGGYSLSFGMFD